LAKSLTQSCSATISARLIGIDDDDLPCLQCQKGVSDSSAGSVSAELNHTIAPGVGQFSPKTFCEAPPVGIMSHTAAILQNNRIDGTECRSMHPEPWIEPSRYWTGPSSSR
jgi:hypothetical protein